MELWLKPARLTGTQCVAFVGASADAGFGLWIVDGVLEGRAGTTRVSMSSALTTDDWHHVAFIVSDHTASLRVDGVEVATSSGATLPALVKGFGVGLGVSATTERARNVSRKSSAFIMDEWLRLNGQVCAMFASFCSPSAERLDAESGGIVHGFGHIVDEREVHSGLKLTAQAFG